MITVQNEAAIDVTLAQLGESVDSTLVRAERRDAIAGDHGLTHELRIPFRPRHARDATEREKPYEVPVLDDRIGRVPAAPGDLIHEPADRHVRLDRDRISHHQVADAQVAERVLDQQVAILCRGRLEQEPADEGEPRTAEGSLKEE